MRNINIPEGLITGYFFAGNVLLLVMAMDGFRWPIALIVLPWVAALSSGDGRSALKHVFKEFKWPAVFSALLAGFIFLACRVNDVGFVETKTSLIPLAWMPIAALVRSVRVGSGRWPPDALLIAVVFLALMIYALLTLWEHFSTNIDRPNGLAWNVLSAPIMMCLVCVLGMMGDKYKAQTDRSTKWFDGLFAIAFLTAVAASIYTYSKAGVLLMMLAALMRWWMVPSERLKTALVALPIILFWCWVLTPRFQVIQVDVQQYKQGQHSSSLGDRMDALRWSFERVGERPVFGRGTKGLYADFNARWEGWQRPKTAVTNMPHLHNDYLQLMGAYGVPAALCFGLFWLSFLSIHMREWHQAADSDRKRSCFSWAVIMITMFMLSFFVDSFTHTKAAWLMMMASAGLVFGMKSTLAPERVADREMSDTLPAIRDDVGIGKVGI